MILYSQDWAKYPSAIIDTKTKNVSWLRLASVYRSMGVKNHAFILALVNPQLQGIDPYDPFLTMEQMAMIALECKINPWYFFREVARVPGTGTDEAGMFEANRGLIAAYWLFFNHIMFLWIMIRQTGKSFGIDMLMNLLLNIICINTKINLLTKDDTLRRANIQRLKDQAIELPRYLQQKGPTDLNNTEEISINSMGNRYSTHVPQASPKAAEKVGRGLTTSIFHIDEPPFQQHISIALPAALAAMGAAVDKSKAAGAPYGVILTTTAAKKDDRDGKYVYKLLQEAAVWTEKFFDCANLEELEAMIKANSRGGVIRVNLTMSHRQVGKSDEWLIRKLNDAIQDPEQANRDFFNMWTSGTETSPIPTHLLERIVGSLREVAFAEVAQVGAYITRWYIGEDEIQYRMANSKFILGMDTSEASGRDDISLVLMDAYTLDVVAAGNYNETNLIVFSKWVASFLVRFPNVTAIIERRSTGQMLLDYLLLALPEVGIDPFKRLFNMGVQEYREDEERWLEIKEPMHRRDPTLYTRFKKLFGFATSGSGITSRTALYSQTLAMATTRGPDRVYDKQTIDQIAGLITKKGRIDHPDGEHDDMVIGWLLCFWLITKGVNLGFYGLDSRLLAQNAVARSSTDPYENAILDQQRQLRIDIEALTEGLAKERDEYVSMRIEQQIRALMTNVVVEENEILSVDELIRTAKEKKRNRARLESNPKRNWQHTPPVQSGYSREIPSGANYQSRWRSAA